MKKQEFLKMFDFCEIVLTWFVTSKRTDTKSGGGSGYCRSSAICHAGVHVIEITGKTEYSSGWFTILVDVFEFSTGATIVLVNDRVNGGAGSRDRITSNAAGRRRGRQVFVHRRDHVVVVLLVIFFLVFFVTRSRNGRSRSIVVLNDGDGGGSGGGSGSGSASGSSGSGGTSGGGVMFVRFVRPLRSVLRPLWSLCSVIRLLRVAIRAARPVVVWIVIWPGWSCSPWSVRRPNACRSCPGRCRSFRRWRTTWYLGPEFLFGRTCNTITRYSLNSYHADNKLIVGLNYFNIY